VALKSRIDGYSSYCKKIRSLFIAGWYYITFSSRYEWVHVPEKQTKQAGFNLLNVCRNLYMNLS
jgi:hypothetical protein